MSRPFKLSAADIKPLAEGRGSCLASIRILTDGLAIGFMYREGPDDDIDSGWRFLVGDETQELVDDPMQLGLFDVNTVANYNPEIIVYLDKPAGTAWGRNSMGNFVEEHFPSDPDKRAQ